MLFMCNAILATFTICTEDLHFISYIFVIRFCDAFKNQSDCIENHYSSCISLDWFQQ